MAAMVRARIHPCGGIIRNYSSIHSSAIRLFSHPVSVVPPVKILETFSEEFEVGSHKIKLETGLLARFANGSVVYNTGDTHVLSTVASGKGDNGFVRDFLPLTVEYQEKQYAKRMIPGTFTRREGPPKERELLCGRLIDRPIRPLFPAGLYHEVQIMINVLASDSKQDPDVMAANATSAALMLSDIPWAGPIGVIRLGRVDGQFVINPTVDELSLSDLNLVYACTRDKTLMIDVQARGISENDLEAGLRLAHPEAVKYIDPQIRLSEKVGKIKKKYTVSMITPTTFEKIEGLTKVPIEAVFTDPSYGKFERGEALDKIMQNVKTTLEEECDEQSLKVLPKVVDNVRKKIVRKRIIEEGIRVDGRRLDEVRPLYCDSHKFPALHGSSIFSRGDTQVLCSVTIGTPDDSQRLDSMVGPSSKRFMLHYSFPPFSINEVGKHGGLNRREVGHGTLAEKALLAVLPSEEEFPYAFRLNSEVMASDGSTSMATVCGGSMALMDAGIPITEHVAGISVGLVSDVDPTTGSISEYRIVTDILGLEDHLGDMDFKIAGTKNGVTAIQLDIKPAGIPLDIICESLYHAKKGRLPILDRMEKEISVPRKNTIGLATRKYSSDDLWPLLSGFRKKKIEKETGVRICVHDEILTVVGDDQEIVEKALEMVDSIIGRNVAVGDIFKAVVVSLKEFGAFVEFNGGQQGLLHISELSHKVVSKVSDILTLGDEISLKCIGQDLRGNVKLSLKALESPNGEDNLNSFSADSSSVDAASGGGDDANLVSSDDEDDNFDSGYDTPDIVVRSPSDCESLDSQEKKSSQNHQTVNNQNDVHQNDNRSKNLKVGDTTEATVYQIRVNGLVLDLGGGLKGMYKFEENKKKFKVGMKIQMVCCSFSNKGIPIMSFPQTPGMNDGLKTKLPLPTESQIVGNQRDALQKDSHSKNLKLGDKFKATVYQIRTNGLVLDLGRGLKGMYMFEENRKQFKIGMKIHVVCSSFSTKGVPVMSLLEE